MDCNQGEGKKKRKGESKPNIEVGKKVQWADVQSGFNKDSAFSDTKGESDSDNKWQLVCQLN